ncbi:MAG: exonuclease SbcCD subunit D [Chloroflexi bacterium]|nr:exonuclease SbcCD subunit D [Chloroflexota bacterium]
MVPLKLLHFADAHIDMANYGRHDPQSGLPVRVMDFLKSLDEIVDTAISEKADLVLFAGDAYKDRNPAPTFQREWGRRIIRLSKAKIPTLLLVGNHDLSPSLGRAHALEEYSTLDVPYVKVLDKPDFYASKDLWGLPLQVIALPWVARSQMLAFGNIETTETEEIYSHLEGLLGDLVEGFLENKVDPNLPTVLMAHASVQGAIYGGERAVMLGSDLVLSPSLVKDKRFDYVALGHIHKAQNLNENNQPPVVYPGSIERVDFGEAHDEKFFVSAELKKGDTQFEWRRLSHIRPFVDRRKALLSEIGVMSDLLSAIPPKAELKDAIFRLTIDYPIDFEAFIDETVLREAAADAFEFHLVKRPQVQARVRIPEDRSVSDLSAYDLLDIYWKSAHVEDEDRGQLAKLAKDVIEEEPIED